MEARRHDESIVTNHAATFENYRLAVRFKGGDGLP